MAINMGFLTNPMTWIVATFFFALLFVVLLIFVIILSKMTHAITELKAKMKGAPIAMFFMDSRYCDWRVIKPDAGIITDKDYGAYVINEKATYVDRKTKNILIPFDVNFAGSVNVKAAKLADDLQYIIKDEKQLKQLRYAMAHDMIDDNEEVLGLRTSVYFGAIKTMVNAMLPHNINSKIEKTIAARLKNYGAVNTNQIILMFVAIFGAIVLGGILVRTMLRK